MSAWGCRRRRRSPRGSPSQAAAIAVCPSGSAAGLAPSSQAVGRISTSRPAGRGARRWIAVAVDDALDAEAFAVGEALDGGQRVALVPGGGSDRPGDRMLGGVLERADEPQRARPVGRAAATITSTSSMRPVVTVPVLSSTIVSTLRVDSRISGPLISSPSCAPRPVPDEQRRRRGEPERARAGDDQHRDGGGEREGGALARTEPEAERGGGDRRDDGDEDAGDPVGQPLDGRLAGLRVGDQSRDLGQRGVGADLGRADDEPSADVDGRARRRRRRVPSRPGRTRRSAATRRPPRRPSSTMPSVATFSPGRTTKRWPTASCSMGMRRLGAVVVEDDDVLGPELQQGLERGPGPALGARLEVAAGEDERDDDRGDLEVDVVQRRPSGPGTRSKLIVMPVMPASPANSATTDQVQAASVPTLISVSMVAVAWRRFAHAARWNGQAAHSTTGVARFQRQPLPVVELQRRDHRDQQEHRQREDRRDDQPAAQRCGRVLGFAVGGRGRARRTAASRRSRRRVPPRAAPRC